MEFFTSDKPAPRSLQLSRGIESLLGEKLLDEKLFRRSRFVAGDAGDAGEWQIVRIIGFEGERNLKPLP